MISLEKGLVYEKVRENKKVLATALQRVTTYFDLLYFNHLSNQSNGGSVDCISKPGAYFIHNANLTTE